MGILVIADDNATFRKLVREGLEPDGYTIYDVDDGPAALDIIATQPVDVLLTDIVMPDMDGIELLERARKVRPYMRTIVMTGHGTTATVVEALRNQAYDLLSKPFKMEELRDSIKSAIEHPYASDIQVISAKADWIEISAPCDLSAVEPIQKLMTGMACTLRAETREGIAAAFREMLVNAIEHGGKCDTTKRVSVKYLRLKRAILYSIKDPGEGFSLEEVSHAAFSNPDNQPLQHMRVREQMGLRPGGYGILLASQVIDELVYNEKHNELVFVKYLDFESDKDNSSEPGPPKSH